MASWTDGPEYAPTDRPDVFVEPDTADLPDLTAPDASPAAEPASPPPVRPDYDQPDAAPLDALDPPAAPTRDPREAFDVASTPMTTWSSAPPPPDGEPVPFAPPQGAPPIPASTPRLGPDGYPILTAPPSAPSQSAWGHAHATAGRGRPVGAAPSWTPQQPFPPAGTPQPQHVAGPPTSWPPARVNPGGFPQAGPPPWQPEEPSEQFEPVTMGAILRNSTPGLLICLGVGTLVPPLSLALLVVASVLAMRVRYRRRLIGRVLSGAILGCFTFGFIAQYSYRGYFDPFALYGQATGWAQLACLLLFVVVPLIVGDAMRRRERPEEGL